jgi:hypothetical protein
MHLQSELDDARKALDSAIAVGRHVAKFMVQAADALEQLLAAQPSILPDSFHRHEVMDRTSMVQGILAQALEDHPAMTPKLNKLMKKAQEVLGDLYQAAGEQCFGAAHAAAGQAVQPLPEHDLYVDSDLNKPRSILDSNGQVTLDLCKRCGKGEAELTEPCVRSDSWYGLILKLGCMFDFDAAGSIEEVAVSAAAARDRIFDLRMRLRDAAINKDQSQSAEAPKGFYTFTKPKGWINLADPGQSWEEWTKAQGLPTTRGWFISGETSALSNAGRAKTVAASDDRVFVREVGPFCVNFEYVGAEPAEQSGDKWHEAVLHECMRVESCYVSDDPKQTMLNLINWYHAAWKEEAQSADSRDADLFWNDADPEQCAYSIHEVIDREYSDGSIRIGDIMTIQQAIRLPNIQVRIIASEDDPNDWEYEVISAALAQQAGKEQQS